MVKDCWRCGGIGQVGVRNTTAPGLSSILTAKCPECDGTGKDYSENHERCMHCGEYTDECRCSGGY
jgi:hypothetical protein